MLPVVPRTRMAAGYSLRSLHSSHATWTLHGSRGARSGTAASCAIVPSDAQAATVAVEGGRAVLLIVQGGDLARGGSDAV